MEVFREIFIIFASFKNAQIRKRREARTFFRIDVHERVEGNAPSVKIAEKREREIFF